MSAPAENISNLYPLRIAGVIRVWNVSGTAAGGANANNVVTTGQLVTSPSAILFNVFGTSGTAATSFDAGTVTVKYSTDNSTFAVLTTASLTFTANGIKQVTAADVKTGYYRLDVTATGGANVMNITAVMVALGASDVE